MTGPSPLVRAGLRVPTADGTLLATDVYRPGQGNPAPAVLLRTYLGREKNLAEGLAWAREGFAFVVQDVRGRYGSEGVWDPCASEREDGAAAVAWVAEQPWCDGRVVPMGGSLAAFNAWTAALSGHPAVAAVVSLVPASTRVNFEPGGVLKLYNHSSWWMAHGDARAERTGLFDAMLRESPDLLRHLPVLDLPDRFWADLPSWAGEVAAGPDAVPPWALTDAELAACPLPTLHVGGWHDPHIRATLQQFHVAGSSVSPRPARSLLVGPWTHEMRTGEVTRYGARDYGPASRFPLGRWMAAWLRAALGISTPEEPVPVRVFLGGPNRWLEGEDWPPRPVRSRTWFAAPGGQLTGKEPEEEGRDGFTYDPLDPFPARTGPVDQSDLAERPDALRYTTAPLAAPLTLLGEPRAVLWASSDAPAADWVVRLHEALPDGRTLYLGHGLVDSVRASGSPLVPGEARRYEIPLPPIAVTIPAGHGLCLEVTSGSFPEYARNPQTGACRYCAIEVRAARQTVHRSPGTATCLTLPVVLGGEEEP